MHFRNTGKTDSEVSHSLIYISLYLFLLILFVLLSIKSNSDTNITSQATESIRKKFSANKIFSEFLIEDGTKKQKIILIQDVQREQFKKIIIENFGRYGEIVLLHNDSIQLSISLTSIFYYNSSMIKEEKKMFFYYLSQFISANRNFLKIEMTLGSKLDDIVLEDSNLTNLRFISIYNELIRNRLSEQNFILGFDHTQRKSLLLTFKKING